MPTHYTPAVDIGSLSAAEREIVHRVIKGSNELFRKFVAARTRDPLDVKRAQDLVERTAREHTEALANKRIFYPSLWTRWNFMKALSKRIKSKVSRALSIRNAYQSYKLLINYPETLQTLFDEPTDLQNGQKPPIFAVGCVDSRVDLTTLVSGGLGQVLIRREVACGIEDQNNHVRISSTETLPISPVAAQTFAMAVEKMDIRNIVIVPHGKCGGIKMAADYFMKEEPSAATGKRQWKIVKQPRPKELGAGLNWDLAQAKREVFEDVREKGVDFYLSRMDMHDNHDSEYDRILQAAEICTAVRDLRIAKRFVARLQGGNEVTVSTIYLDLRTLNPHLLYFTPGADDWKLVRLTDHPEIPGCQNDKIEPPPTHGDKARTCSCPHHNRLRSFEHMAAAEIAYKNGID